MTSIEQLDELAVDLDTVGRPDHSDRLRSIIAALRAEQAATTLGVPDGHYFKAWQRVALTLGEVRPQWRDEATGPSAVDSAVAAIRSMAAQCSAQELQTLQAQLTPPAGVPAIRREQIAALIWAQGYLTSTGYERVVESLAQLETWLRTNAPQE